MRSAAGTLGLIGGLIGIIVGLFGYGSATLVETQRRDLRGARPLREPRLHQVRKASSPRFWQSVVARWPGIVR